MKEEMFPQMGKFEAAGQPSREMWERMGSQGESKQIQLHRENTQFFFFFSGRTTKVRVPHPLA